MKRKQIQIFALLFVIFLQACSTATAPSLAVKSTSTHTRLPSTSTPTIIPGVTPSAIAIPPHTSTPLPSWATNFAEPILAAIKDHQPSFDDDFSHTTGKGWYIGYSGHPKYGLIIEDGVLVIRQNGNLGCEPVSNIALNHPNFVLQVELSGLSANGDIDFHGFIGGGPRFFFSVHGSGSGTLQWNFGSRDILGKEHSGNLKKANSNDNISKATIVKRGPIAALYLNAVPLAYINDPDLDAPIHGVMFNCGRYDNVKFWDLDRIPNLP